MPTLAYPPRLALARPGTPLHALPSTSAALGVEILCKRDDLTGAELSGNKVRKLEFLLAEARAQGADTVITCGGEQSNHCRATALAAARIGLAAVVMLRTDHPAAPPAATANILLVRLAGARIRWISRDDWRIRDELMAEEAARITAAGGAPYVIPEGGSSALGSWGYVACAEELAADLAALPPVARTTIIHATGSGGTSAGLIAGAHLLGLGARGIRVACVNVCDDRSYFDDIIGRILRAMDDRWQLGVGRAVHDLEIVDGHVGLGYARSRPEELATIRDLCRRDGVVLDPVYTGKAFHGMATELGQDRTRFGDRIVFVHTGGIFGLMTPALAAELAPLL